MSWKEIKHADYTVELEEPILYVDNESRKRSGHMTHAMTEFAPGCLIDFNANCSAERWLGHSPYGWIEYRISEDSGKTFSEIHTLPYSVESFLSGIYMISVEKAVTCDDGTIVAFCLRNDGTTFTCCEPWSTPTVITSPDGGKTWTDPVEYAPYPGRTYDALIHNGIIYVFHSCNENSIGSKPEHLYRVYTSADNGTTFQELSVVPFDPTGRVYCSFIFDKEDRLHAYAYNINAECEMDHAVSEDYGKTWTLCKPCYLENGIRNLQTALIDGVFVLHGRAKECKGLVVYTSENATDWDEGTIVIPSDGLPAFYSNNVNLRDEKGNFLLIQFSIPYANDPRVNVMHMNLRIKR